MSQTKLSTMELYVPEYCVQGERVPFYMLWNEQVKPKISIILPEGIDLEEIYNVDSKDLEIKNNLYQINNFETDGYLGGVFGSKLYDNPSTIKKVEFVITTENIKESVTKQIELFRPDIKIDDSVDTVIIKNDKNNRPIVTGKIKISNLGKGTAIVRIKILENSEVKEGQPEGFEEFKIKFLQDLNKAFSDLKKKFSQYELLLESLIQVSQDPLPEDKEKQNQVKDTIEQLEHAFDNNEDFLTQFSQGIANAYLKNVSIMTDADAFLAFLKSVGENKILILDSMKVFSVSESSQILNAEILTTDLAQNKYPSVKLKPIKIISDGKYNIPFYQILNSPKVS
ncbi:MAG: hypothetical protein RI100_07315 [Nitrosarchaeum sp.]|jgi:hypothetical protein|uniref:hypothetical protein n=1 Tax=Nitrosarchaeum sp. TaxID=2026886 RepID=UPI002DEB2695|nr:hypothetical protein [Nitrosarchaeum sp.]